MINTSRGQHKIQVPTEPHSGERSTDTETCTRKSGKRDLKVVSGRAYSKKFHRPHCYHSKEG